MSPKKLEKEVWFEDIINKSDNLHYLCFIRKNLGILEVPRNRLPRLIRKLDYRIYKITGEWKYHKTTRK